MTHDNAWSRSPSLKEVVIVAIIATCALALRAWHISGTTLDHFDEGVYAFSALGVSDSDQPRMLYPNQEIFSPPFYFGVGGLTARVLGIAPDQALLLLSILFGTLTVLAVWLIGRAWFGPGAGIAAATLLALSPFHIAFSRTALTDITFTFWLVCALGALVAAVEKNSFRWAIVAGVFTGVAWNTKYHGWFAIAIAGAALVPYCWSLRARGAPWKRPLLLWATSCAVALLCYLPWMLFLRTRPSGYGGMLTHYLGMIGTKWVQNAWRYAELLTFFEGPVSRLAIALAVVGVLVVQSERIRFGLRFAFVVLLLCVAAVALGSIATAVLCTAIAVPLLISRDAPYRHWVVVGWIALWVVAAPVYWPYARLLLPFVAASFIVAGFMFVRAIAWADRVLAPAGSTGLSRFAIAAGLVAICALAFELPSSAQPWRGPRGMSALATTMSERIPTGSRVIAIIEPTAAFYLHRLGRPAFERNGNLDVLDTLSTPAYVVTGGYVRRSKRLRKHLDRLSDKLTPLGIFSVDPYDVRMLDDLSPAAARRYRAQPDSTFDLRLYRFDPGTP